MRENHVTRCEVCGNEVETQAVQCPFCGFKRSPQLQKQVTPGFKIANLEKGMPLVADALQRLHNEIITARRQGDRVLILIHGFGSSGRGGAIKKEVRRQLQFLFDKKEINDFLPGEDCDKRSGRFRQMVRRFSCVEKLVRKPNPGITVVVL
jgi:DNA-directed RNA polymerase subunit RPC12/RpoP